METLFGTTDGTCSGLLAVAGRTEGTLVILFAGMAASFASAGLTESGTPQQRKDKRPPFFLGCLKVGVELLLFVFSVKPSVWPCGVTDILLLAALPFRLRPKILPLDSFDLSPMLSRCSLAVTPLNPVDVGDG
jgi:hypothetical protein